MGTLPLRSFDAPGYSANTPYSHGYLSEILQSAGYSTIAIGKWHLAQYQTLSHAGPFDQWPLGRGFDHFYGFMHAETDQWNPRLARDNTYIDPPNRADYHLSADLTDEAIRQLRDLRSADTSRPFFLYFCPGTAHAPLHAPASYVERYRGAFDHGWTQEARRILARQKNLGLVPKHVDLPTWPSEVPDWGKLSTEEQAVAARLQEVFAGYLTHLDAQLGRLLKAIDDLGEREHTLVVLLSDNGASGEGGALGTVNELIRLNRVPEDPQITLNALDNLGQPGTYPHYPTGWALAGNTPFRNMKKWVHEGGVADPCLVSVPWLDNGVPAVVQYHHVTDVLPTILELLDLEIPSCLRGIGQEPVDGTSFRYALIDSAAVTTKSVQYYESMGHRALWMDGWKVVSNHLPQSGIGNYELDEWELYNTRSDPTESQDLSGQHPELVQKLVQEWHRQAERNHVLPMDDSRTRDPRFTAPGAKSTQVRHYREGVGVQQWTAPPLRRGCFRFSCSVGTRTDGPVFVHGGQLGGFGFGVSRRHICFVYNYLGLERFGTALDISQAVQADVQVSLLLNDEGIGVARIETSEGFSECEIPRSIMLRFDAEGATFVGRDPFSVLKGVAPSDCSADVEYVDIEVLQSATPDPVGECHAERIVH
jgi:arylsulfatase